MLQAAQQLMRRQGIRRLLVLSGEPDWCREQAQRLAATLPGDWPWVGENPPPGQVALASGAMRQLLGQERLHAVFDACHSLDVEALAALSGALRAGSWLLLLTPPGDNGLSSRTATACAGAIVRSRSPRRISFIICSSIWPMTAK